MIVLSQKSIAEIAAKSGFIKDTVEKVVRLADILEYIAASPFGDRLVLKGGTAINLFYFDMPRLSVDIDLDYIGVTREEALVDREKIKNFLSKAMTAKGYFLSPASKAHFALEGFVFSFTNFAGNKDNIKIEINYLDRNHISEYSLTTIRNSVINGTTPIRILEKNELFGSKLAALLSRCKPRDLYDIYKLIHSDLKMDETLLKKCAVFYNCVAGNADIDTSDFSILDGINKNMIMRMLKPVIVKSDQFDYIKATEEVKAFLKKLLTLDAGEKAFVGAFRQREYKPEMLFSDKQIIARIQHHPMALWRCQSKESK